MQGDDNQEAGVAKHKKFKETEVDYEENETKQPENPEEILGHPEDENGIDYFMDETLKSFQHRIETHVYKQRRLHRLRIMQSKMSE